MEQDRLASALRDARVPRYTSFPPANRFTTAVGPDRFRQWLGTAPVDQPLSLYLHVPFCRRLCWFCACRTQGTQTNAPIDRYLEHLEREIAMTSALLPKGARVGHLHLGGGTPTILSSERIDRLTGWLREAFDFQPDAKVSVEIDPCDCDGARLDALLRLGLSRVSIGVQDFDDRVQAAIGRQQGVALTKELVRQVRARGITSVNFDMVYGLPHQTEQTLRQTLDTVLELLPDRLALYGYAHVPWMARRQRLIPEDALPDPDARLALAALAREQLIGAGYQPVGIDHFARPQDPMALAAAEGRVRRNFQGYTTDAAKVLIGLGPSAISSFPGAIVQNAAATGAWQARIAAGELATARGYELTHFDRVAASIIEGLMCNGRVDLAEVARAHGLAVDTLRAPAVRALDRLPGIGDIDGDVVTAASAATVRLLCAQFDPGFDSSAQAYSLAS